MVRGLGLVLVVGCHFHPGADVDAAGEPDVAGDLSGDVSSDWWNTAWGVRFPLTIANLSADALPAGYQVGFAFDVAAAPCTANPDDARIVFGATEQPRVVDAVAPPWTWFPLAAALAPGATSAGEYFVYCGNPAPGPAPADPKQVFDLYDGFDVIDGAVWTVNHNASVSGGKLVLAGAMADNGVVSKTQLPAKRAVDFAAASGATTGMLWWGGFQNGTQNSAPWVLWWTPSNNEVNPAFQGLQSEAVWNGTTMPLDTAQHLYGVENYGTSARYRREDAVFASHDYTGMTPPPAMMSVRLWSSQPNTSLTIDWVRVRRAVDPPPSVTVGAPEVFQ